MAKQPLSIRLALSSELELLEALQSRASLRNVGDRDALLANPDAIEVPAQYIEDGGVFVAEADGSIRGFATILPSDDGNVELDALFVEPDIWRRGIGSGLMERCVSEAHAIGAITLHVVGNPHAEGFYRKCGFEVVGERMMRFGTGLVMKRRLP